MSLDKGKMPNFDASDYRFAIAASRFNKKLVDGLLRDVLETLNKHGIDAENIRLVRVPGASELPYICDSLALIGDYDAIIALGVVVAGETPHHEIIGNSTAVALQQSAARTGIPMINGIIVANNREQAEARTIGKIARGKEFAEAAMEMAWQGSLISDEIAESDEFDKMLEGEDDDIKKMFLDNADDNDDVENSFGDEGIFDADDDDNDDNDDEQKK